MVAAQQSSGQESQVDASAGYIADKRGEDAQPPRVVSCSEVIETDDEPERRASNREIGGSAQIRGRAPQKSQCNISKFHAVVGGHSDTPGRPDEQPRAGSRCASSAIPRSPGVEFGGRALLCASDFGFFDNSHPHVDLVRLG
jgi:hypothetical protein